MRRTLFCLWLSLPFAAALAGPAAIPAFSTAQPGTELPAGWQRYTLGRPERLTEYRIAEAGGRMALRAEAKASVSAVIHRIAAAPGHAPWLAWSWRVDALPAHADMRTKKGDDFAARVYVLFDYDERKLPFFERAKVAAARLIYGDPIPVAALCYVWDNRQPVGHTAWSAYTNRLRMIVLQSGASNLGAWVHERRNVAEDFRAAFGEEAPPVAAIVVAADTDNTGDEALSWFGDFSINLQ